MHDVARLSNCTCSPLTSVIAAHVSSLVTAVMPSGHGPLISDSRNSPSTQTAKIVVMFDAHTMSSGKARALFIVIDILHKGVCMVYMLNICSCLGTTYHHCRTCCLSHESVLANECRSRNVPVNPETLSLHERFGYTREILSGISLRKLRFSSPFFSVFDFLH